MDLLEIAVSALITGLSASIGGFIAFRYAKNSVKEEIFDTYRVKRR